MNRSNSVLTVADGVRNEKLTSPRLVDLGTAFDQALRNGGLRVSDGSVYVAEPVTAEMVEAVYRIQVPFEVPAETTAHFKITLSNGAVQYVSCAPRVYRDSDGTRDFLMCEVENAHIDGVPATLDAELAAEIEDLILEGAE